jgi:hypothetical protein
LIGVLNRTIARAALRPNARARESPTTVSTTHTTIANSTSDCTKFWEYDSDPWDQE